MSTVAPRGKEELCAVNTEKHSTKTYAAGVTLKMGACIALSN